MTKKRKYMTIMMFMIIMIGTVCTYQYMYANSEKAYQRLSGVHIVLDAGHGGKDDGAQSGSVKEQGINLNIVLALKELLEDSGSKVTLTRNGDYDLAEDSAKNRKRSDMEKRVALINQDKVDMFVSVHLNAFPNPSAKGAHTFYKKGDESSKIFGDIVQRNLKELTGTKMTSKIGDYYILNNADKVGVLVECGFLSNAQDRAKLVTEEYQQKVAKCLYDSIVEYFSMLN